jgi:hypothetical protein
MGTLNKLIADVRRRLNYTDERILSEEMVIHFLVDVDDELVTELNLSSVSWLVPRFPLNVSAGKEYYPITAPNFGKGQFIATIKDSNPQFKSSLIYFVDEDSLIARYGGGGHAAAGVEFSMRGAALVTVQGTRQIRVAPIPSMPATYQVVYEPSIYRPHSKGETAFPLDNFDAYIADRAAFKCLPYAGLEEPMKSDIRTALEAGISEGARRFLMYRRSDRQQNNIRTQPWGQNRWGRRKIY